MITFNHFNFNVLNLDKSLRDLHAAVSLQIVLQEGNQHTGRRNHGVVQGMGQVLASILSLHADLQSAGLGIPKVGTASHLKVLLLSLGPRLHVHGLTLRSARSPEQHSRVRTGTSRVRNKSTVFCHS